MNRAPNPAEKGGKPKDFFEIASNQMVIKLPIRLQYMYFIDVSKTCAISSNLEILSVWFISDTSTKFLLLSGEGMARDVAVLCRHQPLTKIKGFVPG